MKIEMTKSVMTLKANKTYTVYADLNNTKQSQTIYDCNDNEIKLSALPNDSYKVIN